MRFRELTTFARNHNGSALAPEAIEALQLPIPRDVLEQFFIDHGLNEEFQHCYGDLDLNQISWSKESLPISSISLCSSKYECHVLRTRDTYEQISSLDESSLSHEAIRSWIDVGTWLRPPIFLFDVLPSPNSRHLVEGHTRVGALQGLSKNQYINASLITEHQCWIGRPTITPAQDAKDWTEVRRRYPVKFKHWLYDSIEDNSIKGSYACALSDAEADHRYELDIGNDLADILRLLDHDPTIPIDRVVLSGFYSEWCTQLGLDI
jgi:hypothetical protein